MSWVDGEFVPASTCHLGGGPAGASGSGAGGPAASAYTPTAQPQADVAYQGIVQNLFPYANNPAISPVGQAYGTLNPYANQLANQGLINQGMQGAQNAYTNYQQSVYPAAQNLGQQIPQGVVGTYGQASANPYTGQAQQGAIDASGYAGNQALLSATGGQNLSASAPNYQQWGLGTGSNIQSLFNPLVGAAQTASGNINALAPSALGTGANTQAAINALAPDAIGTAYNAQNSINAQIDPLRGLSQQLINTGFDPQSALYNRTQQQVTDQARAAAAAAGLSGTPYGVGTENQALSNFNIDWQNQQLARQTQGAQAGTAIQNAISGILGQGAQAGYTGQQLAGNLYGAGNAAQLAGLGLGGNLYNQGLGALTTGYGQAGNLNALGSQVANQGATTAASLLGSGLGLGQGATNLAATGGALPSGQYYSNLGQQTQLQNALAGLAQSGLNIGTQGAQGLSTFGGQPYSSLGQAINNILTPGLSNAAQLGQQQFQLPQQVLQDLQSYLGLGQAASLNSGYLGNLGLQQTAQALGGLGQALGGANALFGGGGGGGGGLLGSGGLLSAGGLLGSQGPLFGTAADASIAAGGPPLALDAAATAGGGGGGILGSILGGIGSIFGL